MKDTAAQRPNKETDEILLPELAIPKLFLLILVFLLMLINVPWVWKVLTGLLKETSVRIPLLSSSPEAEWVRILTHCNALVNKSVRMSELVFPKLSHKTFFMKGLKPQLNLKIQLKEQYHKQS